MNAPFSHGQRRPHLAAIICLMVGTTALRAQLPPETLKAVKDATVFMQVTLADSQVVQGTGFFGVEPNVVLTNAHVLGMLRPEGRRPKQIELTYHNGERDERKFTGQVLGVDRSSDLAVVRVTGTDLPKPLKVVSAKDLRETQDVYVVGFPFGSELGKNITVSKSSVSSLRTDAEGILQKVQVNGGMNPGNSGGPVIDEKGQVVGVAVSGIRQTQINFAIPGDYVQIILNGRVVSVVMDTPYRQGNSSKVAVTMEMLDPLDRVKKVSLDYWAGEPGKPRPVTGEKPKALPSDGPRKTLDLTYEKGKGRSEWELPSLDSNKVIWMQPVYVNGAGQTRWASASVYQPLPAVERKPIALKFVQLKGGQSTVNLTSNASFKLQDGDGDQHTLALNLAAELDEIAEAETDTEDRLGLHVQYRKFSFGISVDNKPLPRSQYLQRLASNVRLMKGEMTVDSKGNVSLGQFSGRGDLREINEQVLDSLQSIAVPLPGKEVTPNQPWQARRNLVIATLGPAVPGLADLSYSYLGVRPGGKGQVAVISLGGIVRSAKTGTTHLAGRVSGTAEVDVTTGQVVSGRTLIDLDLDNVQDGKTFRYSGTLVARLTRTPTKESERSVASAPKASKAMIGKGAETAKPESAKSTIGPGPLSPKPAKSFVAKGGVSLKGQTTALDDLQVTPLTMDAKLLLGCMRWVDEAGSAFYTLDSNGVLTLISYPDLQVVMQKDFERKCAWLDVSAEGLVLSVPDRQEVWLIHPETLEKKGVADVSPLQRAVSAPNLSIAAAGAGDMMYVVDLKALKATKYALSGGSGPRLIRYENPVMSPDGNYLFTMGFETLHRFHLENGKFRYEESSPRIAQGAIHAGIQVSPDSTMVCLPSGGGNYGASSYSTFVYPINNFKKTEFILEQGAYPEAVGFDPTGGHVYSQNFQYNLIRFSATGIKKKENKIGTGRNIRQYLVHPAGNKVLLLSDNELVSIQVPPKP